MPDESVNYEEAISADAGGPRDAASRPIATIALYTELDVECDQQSTIVGRC